MLRPFVEAARRLVTIPGVGDLAAATIIAEIGVDMSRFPTSSQLISWAGLCPRMEESAGKARSTRIRKGAPWLKPLLVQCAWGAVRMHDTYLNAQYNRIERRRGPKKAIIAVAASILTSAYHMLKDESDYIDLGPDFLQNLNREARTNGLIKRLNALGYGRSEAPRFAVAPEP